jgi:DNA invertase Pin-like site-specific DNA recombinase
MHFTNAPRIVIPDQHGSLTVLTKSPRILTYSRVSTSHHDQKPEVQTHELRRYCSARGWEIVEEIVDHGYSGGTENRPGLKRLMALARGREVDGVVVVKLDRLFRSLKHLVTTLDEFQALGILFVATKDNIDYSTPSGRLFVQVLASLAEFEKELLRERTILGLNHARAQGKRLGRPRHLKHDTVRRLHREGLTYREIASTVKLSKSAVHRSLKQTPHSFQT